MRLFRDNSDESGAALALVLGFVIFAGLVIGGLLNQVQNNSTTLVARKLNIRVMSANAGLDYAIRKARASGTVCPGVGLGGTIDVPVADQVNSRPVTVQCSVTKGGATGAGGWAVFITNGAGKLESSNGNLAKVIEGDVYNGGSGGVSVSGGLAAVIKVKNGKYVQRLSGACPPAGLELTPIPSPFGGTVCGTSTLNYLVDAPSPRSLPVSIGGFVVNPAAVAPTTATECRIFSPGIYSDTDGDHSGGLKLNSLSANNYFKPGIYIIKLNGPDPVWHIRRWVTAGRPNSNSSIPDIRQTSSTNCPAAQLGADNDGAIFLLAGATRISVEKSGAKNGHFEVFSYLGADLDTPAVAIRKLLASDATSAPWVVGDYISTNNIASPDAILRVSTGTGPEIALHGNTWVPESKVEMFATNTSRANMRGGIVAGWLDLAATSSLGPEALAISASSGTGQRRMVLTSTVTKIPPEKDLFARAVVDIVNDSKHTANVVSWFVANK
jgi:hypothetical protein